MPDTFHALSELSLHQWIGLLGFCIYVLNYCCLSFRVLSSESALYFIINTIAASLVLISLTTDFNLASALIQTFWIAIGICAVALRLHRQWRTRRNLIAAIAATGAHRSRSQADTSMATTLRDAA